MRTTALTLLLLSIAPIANAQVSSVDLSNYRLAGTYALPSVEASEASAVTWNWDRGTLFVLGDEGDALVEVTTTGTLIGSMSLTGFDDTEGLTYLGGGQFVLVEERLQDAFLLTYSAGGAVNRSSLASVSIGATVGNIGLEGITYDPITGGYITVKEKDPQAVTQVNADFATGTATTSSLFTPSLGLLDLSDVQALSTVTDAGSADAANLLIFSQESSLLLEVDRSGGVLGMFSLAGVSTSTEGVTIDGAGNIYLVDESPFLYVLKPVPLPAAVWLLLSGVAGLFGVSRRSIARR